MVAFHKTGLSSNEIAKNLKISRWAVQSLVKKHRATGSALDRKGRGRKKVTTEREVRLLIRLAL